MIALLGLFSGPYAVIARLALVGIALAVAAATGWVKGNAHGTQKLIDYQAAQTVQAARIIVRQSEATERVVTKYRDRVSVIEGATTTIEKEVVRYVDSKPLALACMLDNRWVRLHDSAALAVPAPAERADDAAGALAAAQALPTITRNYAAANRNAARLESLQEWIRAQIKATNAP